MGLKEEWDPCPQDGSLVLAPHVAKSHVPSGSVCVCLCLAGATAGAGVKPSAPGPASSAGGGGGERKEREEKGGGGGGGFLGQGTSGGSWGGPGVVPGRNVQTSGIIDRGRQQGRGGADRQQQPPYS